ncbi:putative secreted protein (Por secretion system target) [Lutibacter sp. Hel_I_33_5]|nr:putative secreted protein (Por secretion system target) [Lutibacter sp. Hel_I_33_5]
MLIVYTIDTNAQCSTAHTPEITGGGHVDDIFTSYQGNADASPQIHYALTIAQSFTANCDGILSKIGIYKFVLKGSLTRFAIYNGETASGTPVQLTNVNVETAFVQDGALTYIDLSSLNKVLVNGQQYTFLIESVDTGGSGNANIQQIAPGIADSSYPYVGGKIIAPSGWDTRDLAFKVITNPFVLPTVTTTVASSITQVSADFAGNITSNGGSAVTERGVVYSITDTTPEIGETGVTKDNNGTGTGVFTENITGLTKGNTYYHRAYAINSVGTSYGEIKNFRTFNNTPTVATISATSVTTTSASLGGNVENEGDSSVTERGIVYSSTDTNPKIGDNNVTKDDNGTSIGTFSESITGLTANTTYFYRAYAINTQGTSYGEVKNFKLNNALNFDGTNDRITIADNAAFDFSSGFTAEAWINPDVLGTQTYLSQYDSGQEAFAFILLSSGKIEFTVTTDGNSDQFFESSTAIVAGIWSHVALTFDGTTVKAYINGVASGTNSVSGTMFASTAPIEIGARNNAHFFNGTIDEVRIWTRTLTITEILAQKDGVLPSTVNGLAAYYKMNQGIAEGDNTGITTISDSGPNNLDGTLTGFTKTGATSNFVSGVSSTFENGVMAPNTFKTTGNWSIASNWNLGVVPTQIDKVTIGSGKTVTIDVDNLKINDFTLENTAVLNIPKDKEITIQNSFVSNGTLELSSDRNDSGVLLLEGTATGNVTYKRGGLLANKWSIVTPPVSGQTVKTFAENAANNIRVNTIPDPDRYAIGFYDDSQAIGNKWQYYDANVSASTEFIAGNSYSISRATDGEVSFTGTLTASNVFKTLIADQWNAIGNPFTTYYPANKNSSSSFLNDNINALDDNFKSLYLWDNDQNKYVAVSEVDAANRSLPPGQGFFIRMKAGQTEINFKEAKRSAKPASGTTDFARVSNNTPSIELKISDDTNTVKTAIKYFDVATVGLDPGYDIGNFNGASLDIFTHLLVKSTGTDFTIQSLPTKNYENMIIPVGVIAKKGKEVTITAEILNLPNNIELYLEDREQKIFTKLSKENSNYKIVLENNINSIGRFYLHTTSEVLGTDKTTTLVGVKLYQTNNILTIKGLLDEIIGLKIYSVLGKEVLQTSFRGNNNNKVSLPKLTSGVYIIKLETAQGKLDAKIIIE